ncbi:hypothetical protein QO010_000161 [Caulobacter ginsengisoli]|uniref:Fido domain-containing protein n=1 Tax=Caulobacter ginsengisoli TaxID=400775 RepID=A0ABU0IK71_9CAUL|nr:Fic family protein [Caulobacter ginsengisoli]MDQ0462413.1 hypothetical protein [Caulobacter ginsengisoli]
MALPPNDLGARRWLQLLSRILDETPAGFETALRRWLAALADGPPAPAPFVFLQPLSAGRVAEDQKDGQALLAYAEMEWGLRDRYAAALADSLAAADPAAFIALLKDIAAAASDRPAAEFRTGPAETVPDDWGQFVRYPDAAEVPDQMARLWAFLHQTWPDDPVRAAVVAYVAIQNAHPFADGNGRLSRIVFNSLVRPAGPYLPLRELNGLTRGGLLMPMRGAEIHDRWEAFAVALGQAVRTLHRVVG